LDDKDLPTFSTLLIFTPAAPIIKSSKPSPLTSPAEETYGGTADEGITYSIKGTNADKFSITAGTGILTYKTIQTSVHDDTRMALAS
jgi:hypothetical protein